jgi:hypothetical protein
MLGNLMEKLRNMNLWFIAPEVLAEIEISTETRGTYRVRSHTSDNPRSANPEEIIRQLVMAQLRCHYHYPHERLTIEFPVKMGITKKRADIAILSKQGQVETLIEIKQTVDDESILQLQSYMIATAARYGAVISLHFRTVFRRNDDGSFFEISDLPLFDRGPNTDIAIEVGQKQRKDKEPAHNTLMTSLGISGIIRLSSTTSQLLIRNKALKFTNSTLLNYSAVRKRAIQEGIFLPSTIKNRDWDELLSSLFENATENETSTGNDEISIREKSFESFYEQVCEVCDQTTETLFKDIYEAFSIWYKANVEESQKFLPSKKNVSAQLVSKGFIWSSGDTLLNSEFRLSSGDILLNCLLT